MDESRVDWREWGKAAFAAADRLGRPVLVWLTTSWCVDCRRMARETFGDPRIAANVSDGFVPIRVDAERHPRVRERYAMGGFPSTVFCTPGGEVIAGGTFLAPDDFRALLDRVRETYDAKGDAAGSVPRALRTEPPGGGATERVVRHVAGQLDAQWDDRHAGWGTDAKFPLPATIRFALRHARERAERALAAVDRGLRAPDGGFYRYAREPDWSDPARERTLAVNAAILRAFADGYLTTGDERYRGTATATVRFLRESLATDLGFAASLGPEGSRDDTLLAGPVAGVADATLAHHAYTDDAAARAAGVHALRGLVRLTDADGRVVRVRDDRGVGEHDLLADAGRAVRALGTARQVLGERVSLDDADQPATLLGSADAPVVGGETDATSDAFGGETVRPAELACRIADRAIDVLGERDAFRDGPATGAGLLDRPLYSVDGTGRFADALLDLAAITGEARYRERARRALSAFADATDRMGVQVAGYARAVERASREPTTVAVGTPAGSDLHRAALRLADHGKVVVPAASDVPDDAATIRGTDEIARDPETLASLVARHAGR